MDISVTGRHVEVTDSMRDYILEKVPRLRRLYDRIEAVQVVVDRDSTRIRTEFVLRTDHKQTFVARMSGEAFHESVDLAMDRMERQLHEHKEKIRNRKHRPGAAPGPR
ncbi:MAG: ribosome-associated translation inhibitor RaiA [Planctomycetes bacterium]|nr:ribosome-associated translation inhibitor RaiA [Planctomycetota bacterium]